MAVRILFIKDKKTDISIFAMLLISITENLKSKSGKPIAEMKDDILLQVNAFICAWFLFFFCQRHITYYDANKINYVSQGIFVIHLVGLSFYNGNWMYICTTCKYGHLQRLFYILLQVL